MENLNSFFSPPGGGGGGGGAIPENSFERQCSQKIQHYLTHCTSKSI